MRRLRDIFSWETVEPLKDTQIQPGSRSHDILQVINDAPGGICPNRTVTSLGYDWHLFTYLQDKAYVERVARAMYRLTGKGKAALEYLNGEHPPDVLPDGLHLVAALGDIEFQYYADPSTVPTDLQKTLTGHGRTYADSFLGEDDVNYQQGYESHLILAVDTKVHEIAGVLRWHDDKPLGEQEQKGVIVGVHVYVRSPYRDQRIATVLQEAFISHLNAEYGVGNYRIETYAITPGGRKMHKYRSDLMFNPEENIDEATKVPKPKRTFVTPADNLIKTAAMSAQDRVYWGTYIKKYVETFVKTQERMTPAMASISELVRDAIQFLMTDQIPEEIKNNTGWDRFWREDILPYLYDTYRYDPQAPPLPPPAYRYDTSDTGGGDQLIPAGDETELPADTTPVDLSWKNIPVPSLSIDELLDQLSEAKSQGDNRRVEEISKLLRHRTESSIRYANMFIGQHIISGQAYQELMAFESSSGANVLSEEAQKIFSDLPNAAEIQEQLALGRSHTAWERIIATPEGANLLKSIQQAHESIEVGRTAFDDIQSLYIKLNLNAGPEVAAIAGPTTPEEQIQKRKAWTGRQRQEIASTTSNQDDLKFLSGDRRLAKSLAKNPNATPGLLTVLWFQNSGKDEDDNYRYQDYAKALAIELINNRNTPIEVLQDIFNHREDLDDAHIAAAFLRHPAFVDKIPLPSLKGWPQTDLWFSVISNSVQPIKIRLQYLTALLADAKEGGAYIDTESIPDLRTWPVELLTAIVQNGTAAADIFIDDGDYNDGDPTLYDLAVSAIGKARPEIKIPLVYSPESVLTKDQMKGKGFKGSESFDHAVVRENAPVPGYTLDAPGKDWVRYIYATTDEFPTELYQAFNLHDISPGKILGWVGGTWDGRRKILFVTEMQSDMLQRTFELTPEHLAKHKVPKDNILWQSVPLKSRIENRFDGWLYVFFNQAMKEAQVRGALTVAVPTQSFYAREVPGARGIASIYEKILRNYTGVVLSKDKHWNFIPVAEQTKVASKLSWKDIDDSPEVITSFEDTQAFLRPGVLYRTSFGTRFIIRIPPIKFNHTGTNAFIIENAVIIGPEHGESVGIYLTPIDFPLTPIPEKKIASSNAEIEYPTVEDIIECHNDILTEYGGREGVFPETVAKLEAAIGRMQSGGFGQEFFPTLVEKAAVLMHSIITTHPFQDVNKRTALMSGVEFLHHNGLTIPNSDSITDIILLIADDKAGYEQLLEQVQANTKDLGEHHDESLQRLSTQQEFMTATDGLRIGTKEYFDKVYRYLQDQATVRKKLSWKDIEINPDYNNPPGLPDGYKVAWVVDSAQELAQSIAPGQVWYRPSGRSFLHTYDGAAVLVGQPLLREDPLLIDNTLLACEWCFDEKRPPVPTRKVGIQNTAFPLYGIIPK